MPQILAAVKATLRAPAAALTAAAVCLPIPKIEAKEQTKAPMQQIPYDCLGELRGQINIMSWPPGGMHHGPSQRWQWSSSRQQRERPRLGPCDVLQGLSQGLWFNLAISGKQC